MHRALADLGDEDDGPAVGAAPGHRDLLEGRGPVLGAPQHVAALGLGPGPQPGATPPLATTEIRGIAGGGFDPERAQGAAEAGPPRSGSG